MAEERFSVMRSADLSRQLWRNGHGVTRQLWPAESPDRGVLWRLSLAEILGSARFSVFPGIDRQLLLAQGDRLVLLVNGVRRVVTQGDVASFAGEAHVEVLESPSTTVQVLNLMTRRASLRGDLQRTDLDGPVTLTPSSHAAVVVLAGSLVVPGQPPLTALDAVFTGDEPVEVRAHRATVGVVKVRTRG